MKSNKHTKPALLTSTDFDDVFSEFSSDVERLKYMKRAYKDYSIAETFNIFYNETLDTNTEVSIDAVNVEVGQCYWGTVDTLNKSGVSFVIPGVKDELVSKENFSDCLEAVQSYLLSHENKLYFEVREKKHGKYYVSVLNGFYNLWVDSIEKAIAKFDPITVHIDSLTKGGYLCHTAIAPLCELTGKTYTAPVFIPGSNIVMNIERNFEKWIDQDVQIVPQKFVKFQKYGAPSEMSLIGSRKLVLQQIMNQNLYDIYNRDCLLKLNPETKTQAEVFIGTVTGIINSNKTTGIFIELDGSYITGLMPVESDELLDYKPGDQLRVYVSKFEIQPGKEAFVMNKAGDKVIHSNTRCVFGKAY